MVQTIPLAMLSVVPLCSGAPLNPRLQEILTWFLDHQRTIDSSLESGSTVAENPEATETTTSNFAPTTFDATTISILENTTTTATATATTPMSACDAISMSQLKYIGLFLAILVFLCVVGLVVFRILRLRRNRKSARQADEEEGILERGRPTEHHPCKFRFWWPEMQKKSDKTEGFVTISDNGKVVDVKYWSMQQLDAYFAEKSCLKDKGFLH